MFLSQHCEDSDVLTPIYPPIPGHVPRNYRGLWNPIPELTTTGGSPIRSALRDLSRRNRFYNHLSARIIKSRLRSAIWNDYFKFCVERNPWDKTLSHYHMINDRGDGRMTLDQYMSRGQFCINYPSYTDANGKLLVDRVVKYESMIEELAEVFKMLEIPFSGSLGVRAKSEHRKDRRSYRNVFSNQHQATIARVFAREIEMHGYTF